MPADDVLTPTITRRAGAAAPPARRRPSVTTGLCLMVAGALLAGWLGHRALRSARSTVSAAQRQLRQMTADAGRIARLRQAPRTVAARSRPHEALLAQVERALASAGVAADRWQDSIPQAAVRPRGSDVVRYATRLYVESLTLRQLAAFATTLTADDPTLRIERIELLNTDPARPEFDVTLTVAYRVYRPASPAGANLAFPSDQASIGTGEP